MYLMVIDSTLGYFQTASFLFYQANKLHTTFANAGLLHPLQGGHEEEEWNSTQQQLLKRSFIISPMGNCFAFFLCRSGENILVRTFSISYGLIFPGIRATVEPPREHY